MKILKPGKVEQRKFVCEKCGCEFVAESTDVRYPQGLDYVSYISCPCCGYIQNWKSSESYEEKSADAPSERLRMFNLFVKSIPPASSWDLVDYLTENGIGFKDR